MAWTKVGGESQRCLLTGAQCHRNCVATAPDPDNESSYLCKVEMALDAVIAANNQRGYPAPVFDEVVPIPGEVSPKKR